MQDFIASSENISATLAELRQAEVDQPTHYVLCHYLDHGWEWVGVGMFDGLCCERPYATARSARTAADAAIRTALTA